MRKPPIGLPLTTKALAFVVLAAFSMTATVADAKPRKRTQVERTKERSKSRPTATASAADREDGARWRYGSSAIMVDANTGKVLYEDNADALRHPASVTKIMTLYLLFEQLEEGKLKLNSDLDVSARAAAQEPSKLGVRPGSTLEVEDAIKSLVTRSANDVAVVIAENIGGSESDFAEMMTDKARALGMSRTVFRNASGLPNPNQVTTARDLSILGRAIQDRFPKYYRYFSTRTFYYRGQAIGNHNRLLGRIDGVDGIKTGYTRASGFNLVTSVKRDGRSLVGVVLGGSSGGSRDARMTSLISQTLPVAYAGMRTAPKVVENADAAPFTRQAAVPVPPAREPETPHAVAPLPKPQMAELAPEPATTASLPPAKPQNRQQETRQQESQQVKVAVAEPIRPVSVKTVAISRTVASGSAASTGSIASTGFGTPSGVLGYFGPSGAALLPPAPAAERTRPAPKQVASLDPAPLPAGKDQARYAAAAPSNSVPATAAPVARASVDASEQAHRAARIAAMEPNDPYAAAIRAAVRVAGEPVKPAPAARPVRTASLGPVAAPQPTPQPQAVPQPAPARTPAPPAAARSGWQIQIGAYGGEREARARLDVAKSRAKSLLGNAEAYTEKVVKGSSELYRARFAGLNEKGAQEACRLLKRNDFDCMTIRN